jgi:hypothetical protein
MMAQYPNSGKLSPNKYKESGDKKPDKTGELIMERSALKKLLEETDEDDIVIKLSCWDMSGNYGPWFRLAWNNYKPAQKENPYAQPQKPKQAPIDEDSIPF